MSEINSREYWEERFETDWEERGGPDQSRFFAALAAEHLPEWFRSLAGRGPLSICDWGCAEGDGTALLAEQLPNATLTGVDFSEAAIRAARTRFPALDFRSTDYLAADTNDSYDVVFCSNTLEHFPEPWDVFSKIGRCARRFLIVLIPFREPSDRLEDEHCLSFDYEDLRLWPTGDWRLLHSEVIEARFLPETRWLGEQILLVYARESELATLDLSLAVTRLDGLPSRRCFDELTEELTTARETWGAEQARLFALRDELTEERDSARAEVQSAAARIQELEERLASDAARIAELTRWHEELVGACDRLAPAIASASEMLGPPAAPEPDPELGALAHAIARIAAAEHRLRGAADRLAEIYASVSWRWTRPLRRLVGVLPRSRSGKQDG